MGATGPIVARGGGKPKATRRPGVRERVLIGEDRSVEQNLVLVFADEGAVVEEHPVEVSESFYVLEGVVRVFGPGFRERLEPGDAVLFPAGTAHGVEVERGPARWLVVFAPSRARAARAGGVP